MQNCSDNMALVKENFKALFGRSDLLQENVRLSEISNWKVGGRVSLVIKPKSVQDIVEVREVLNRQTVKSLVVGNTSNLLFTDDDIDAVLIKIADDFSKVVIDQDEVIAQSGVWVPKLARLAMKQGLSGLEHTCGIPGTLGGLIVMNGGSQRKGIGDNVIYVKTVDSQGNLKCYTQSECDFGYRRSVFQERDEIIVEVALKLKSSKDKKKIRTDMLNILRDRSKKFPRKLPNCGSVFVSNPAMYEKYGAPGKVIEDCGLKGLMIGAAQVSYNHANFIVNTGNAKAKDILSLIKLIRDEVYNKTGYLMAVEPKYVNSEGLIIPI